MMIAVEPEQPLTHAPPVRVLELTLGGLISTLEPPPPDEPDPLLLPELDPPLPDPDVDPPPVLAPELLLEPDDVLPEPELLPEELVLDPAPLLDPDDEVLPELLLVEPLLDPELEPELDDEPLPDPEEPAPVLEDAPPEEPAIGASTEVWACAGSSTASTTGFRHATATLPASASTTPRRRTPTGERTDPVMLCRLKLPGVLDPGT